MHKIIWLFIILSFSSVIAVATAEEQTKEMIQYGFELRHYDPKQHSERPHTDLHTLTGKPPVTDI